MSVEPHREVTHLPTDGQVVRQGEVTHITGPQLSNPKAPVKSDPQHPAIDLSSYQKQLLEEIKKRPEIMSLLNMIFREYPALVIKEFRMTSPNASQRMKRNGRKVSMDRLNLEATVEELVCRIAGIDINQIASDNLDKPEKTADEVEDAVIEEENTPVDIQEPAKKKTTKKKVAKKTTKKKKTTKE